MTWAVGKNKDKQSCNGLTIPIDKTNFNLQENETLSFLIEVLIDVQKDINLANFQV